MNTQKEYFNRLDPSFKDSLSNLKLIECSQLRKWLTERINYLENIPHLKKEVKDLNLSTRAYNALLNNKITTVEEILQFGWQNISLIKNIGTKTAAEIKKAIEIKTL